ncbi:MULTISPECIES: hypothetical protein [Staphylococcus]|uniref:hypothetical protein n=1 Tax=Staphylococcus TaxID=1279 RepID=UPI001F3B69B2|nr:MULTISPECIES: hypothetical protein [Staphylococcus]
MKIDLIRKTSKLLDIIKDENIKDITGYKVSKETGIPPATISYLTSGTSKLENLTAKKIEALYNYMVELEETDKRFKS